MKEGKLEREGSPSVAYPLAGRRVMVTRARAQAGTLSDALRQLGAEVIQAPAIRIEPPEDWTPLDSAIESLDSYDWIVFTSANGVTAFLGRLRERGKDARHLAGARLAAIGPATAAALAKGGLEVDVVPERFVAEEVFEALRRQGPLSGARLLLPRADRARPALPELLREEGATVDVVIAYRTVVERAALASALKEILSGRIDVVTFTSGSTVRGFFSGLVDQESLRGKFIPASIGPVTSRALRAQGFHPGIEARVYTIAGLVEAIAAYFAGGGQGGSGERPAPSHPFQTRLERK